MDNNKNGKIFEKYIKEKYGLINEFKQNTKLDSYGNDYSKIQIKLHKKGTEICLGSIMHYSFMNDDFLLVIGEYKDKIEIDKLKINFLNLIKKSIKVN